jgi:hypothetical protein
MSALASREMALLNLAAPFNIMKFTLHFDGDLPATGNSPKPADVWRIRNQFHPQLVDLWASHPTLKRLAATRVPRDKTIIQVLATGGPTTTAISMPVTLGGIQPGRNDVEDVCPNIKHSGSQYLPLVR